MGLNLPVYSHTKVNRNNTTILNLPDMFRQTYGIFSCRSSLQFEFAITTILMKTKCDKRTVKREKETAKLTAHLT